MSNRSLTILACLAVVLAVVTAVLYSPGRAGKRTFARGALLIQGLDPAQVDSIVIRKGSDTVTLKRGATGFLLAERQDYPASTKEINDLLIDCLDIRCAAKVTDDVKNHGALGVAEDSPEAVTVTFVGRDGKPLVVLVKGKSLERGSGVYVRLANQDAVYASEKYLTIDTKPTDYLDKKLFTVKREQVERVTVSLPEQTYTIARDDDDAIALQGVPEGKRPKDKEYESVFGALAGVYVTDVARADALEVTWDAVYECRMKNGLVYTVNLASKDDKHYLRASAEAPAVEKVSVSLIESDEELKKKDEMLLAATTAKTFTARHEGWAYEVSKWSAEKMRKSFADLIEDVPTEKTPDEIAASHILISYEGAERSKSTRTRAEARTLAEEVLQKAKAEGADFAELAKQYSDGPMKDKGGDLGTFGKGKMAPAFEKAAFALEIGGISDVVETPFGFHIIKRTQ